MAIRITDDTMTPEIGNHVVTTAQVSEHAAADGNGAWIVSTDTACVHRDQATALAVVDRGRASCVLSRTA